jgi:FixJ family two-component response regulator
MWEYPKKILRTAVMVNSYPPRIYPIKTMLYVIENDQSVTNSLKLYFASVNQPSQFFESAEEFFNFFSGPTNTGETQTFRPTDDLLIIDFSLPGMNGNELTTAILERFQTKQLNVIFISGHTRESIESWTEDEFDADFLLKPFSLDDLEASIARRRNRLTER